MKILNKLSFIFIYIFLVLNVISTEANANIYAEELDKSIDLYSKEDYEMSITILDNLIKSGGLDEIILTRAFLYRGLSNYKSENHIAAITDITNSLWLDLLSDEEKITALETRSLARAKIGQDDLANQDASSIEKLSKIDGIEDKLKSKNIEDISVEGKINSIKNRFSINVGNFFGGEEIEFTESPTSNSVIKDSELYSDILNFNSSEKVDPDQLISNNANQDLNNNLFDISKKENLNASIGNDNALKKDIKKIYNEQVNYILISKGLDLSSAKVKINRIINDNFRVLSGIKPKMIENDAYNGSNTFDIIIGPFSNTSRMDKIAESLTRNNYSFTIEKRN